MGVEEKVEEKGTLIFYKKSTPKDIIIAYEMKGMNIKRPLSKEEFENGINRMREFLSKITDFKVSFVIYFSTDKMLIREIKEDE